MKINLIYTAENVRPLVEVSLNGDIALHKNKSTARPTHHCEPDEEPGRQDQGLLLKGKVLDRSSTGTGYVAHQ